MTTRFSPPLFPLVLWGTCLTFLLHLPAASAADHFGPVLPGNAAVDTRPEGPLPLPRNPALLQRPQNRQVVFDDLDPVGTVLPNALFREEGFSLQPQVVSQQQLSPTRMTPVIENNNGMFASNGFAQHGEVIYSRIISERPMETCARISSGPFPVPYGMGMFDNITLFAETTSFKTGLSEGGSLGLSQGINWSFAVTPQGAMTAQYSIRAVQADFPANPIRSQLFMTAGLFKRFDFMRTQGGVAVDWLEDQTLHHGRVELQQLRCELSARIFNNWECGFMGGFDVFQKRRSTRTPDYQIGVHDYYLVFIRKYTGNGGMFELRSGLTAHGDFILHTLGEKAISDRLAVNGGLSVLSPSGRRSGTTNLDRESWTMSMGIVIYFRGGAIFRHTNLHRPLFDAAGNSNFFTRTRVIQ